MPASTHAPLEQQAILLKRAEKSEAALAFVHFLRGAVAAAVIREHGYATLQ